MTTNTSFSNNEQVNKQLKHMCNFIIREANEKASEILQKAKEQFSKEKTDSIREATKHIEKEFEKKKEAISRKKKISYSHALNASRLEILKEKEKIIEEIMKEGKEKLATLGNPNDPSYKTLLQSLLTQAFLTLSEPQVEVRCRQVDLDLVESILKHSVEEYKKRSSKELVAHIDKKRFLLPPRSEQEQNNFCSGGVVVVGYNGRITCDNTLDQRLLLAFEGLLPEVRVTLFGASETRKYHY